MTNEKKVEWSILASHAVLTTALIYFAIECAVALREGPAAGADRVVRAWVIAILIAVGVLVTTLVTCAVARKRKERKARDNDRRLYGDSDR